MMTTQYKIVDLKDINCAGGIKDGCELELKWGDSSIVKMSISTKDGESFSHIDYRELNSELLHLTKPLESVQCNFGGYRWYFRCNSEDCNKRVRVLYKTKDNFSCRLCAKVKYRSSEYSNRIKNKYCRDFYYVLKSCRYLMETKGKLIYNNRPTRKLKMYLKLSKKVSGGMPPFN